MPHLHLISAHQYPRFQQLQPDQAYTFLRQAPELVKLRRPVAWTFIAPPDDGTTFLEWIPPQRERNYASDGYVWADAERGYEREYEQFFVRHTKPYSQG